MKEVTVATIKKNYTTRVDNVVVAPALVRVSVSLVDADDPQNVSAHMVVALKDGKVVQPQLATAIVVDPAIAVAAKTILDACAKVVDQVATQGTVFIRGSVDPAPRRP
jgi:hypothetical protein